jgi:hypothetical protein
MHNRITGRYRDSLFIAAHLQRLDNLGYWYRAIAPCRWLQLLGTTQVQVLARDALRRWLTNDGATIAAQDKLEKPALASGTP